MLAKVKNINQKDTILVCSASVRMGNAACVSKHNAVNLSARILYQIQKYAVVLHVWMMAITHKKEVSKNLILTTGSMFENRFINHI